MPSAVPVQLQFQGTVSYLDLNGHQQAVAGLYNSNGTGCMVTNSSSSAASLTLNGPGTYVFTALIADRTNGGAVSLTVSGGMEILGGSNTYHGVTLVSGGTLVISNNVALQNSPLVVNGGTLQFATASCSTPSLSGTQGFALTNQMGGAITLTVGANGSNTTFSGSLSSVGSLIKVGAGTLTLSGPNSYTGGTIVSNGTLQVNGSMSGAVTVVTNAALAGAGQVTGVLTNGGVMVATITNVLGGAKGGSTYVKVNGSLVLLPGAQLSVADPNNYLSLSDGPYTVLSVTNGTITPPVGGFTATLPRSWYLNYQANTVTLEKNKRGCLIMVQ